MLWARPSHMGVVEVAVYGFGVVAAGEEGVEVGVSGRDGAEVLGPVQLAGRVLLVAVESHGDRRAVVVSGELVVVVPALAPSLVLVALVRMRGRGTKCRSPVAVYSPMPSAPPRAKSAMVWVVPSVSVMLLSSRWMLFSTRWPSPRRGFFAPALAAVTRLMVSSPSSRSRCWWWTPRRAVS